MKSRGALILMLGAMGAFALSQTAFSAPPRGSALRPAAGASPLGTPQAWAAGHTAELRDAAAGSPVARPVPGFLIARMRPGRSTALRARPGGRIVARVGPRTEFGSPGVLGVVAVRGRWLGVSSPARPNGRLAWVDRRGVRVVRTRYSLRADLSRRTLELRRGRRLVRRLHVAVGRPGSPTPAGRFAVTDKLRGTGFGPYYGCCILALSGHQPSPPPGWKGGNRLAIHGTSSPGTIGTAASAGCLRAADADLAVLMRRVPVGTPLFIRR